MPRVLLVTNDFPPTVGGIQSYLRDFVGTLPPHEIVVFASTQDARAAKDYDAQLPFQVVRWPRRVMLPTPATSKRMCELIAQFDIETVWFGAAAPLGLMGKAAKAAGARRVVASTHGHEVGWAKLPGARSVLRRIGNATDVVTYISDYTLRRLKPVFGSVDWRHVPSGVDTERFRPQVEKVPQRPTVCCISRLVARKGQDSLIRSWPEVVRRFPDAQLVIVGSGRYLRRLNKLAAPLGDAVRFTGALNDAERTTLLASADVFAMPARTRLGGIDVEGLGIVYLEAQACGVPVIAGTSGGAPETLTADSGIVVDGRDIQALSSSIIALLEDPELRAQMGAAGRRHVQEHWSWDDLGGRLREVLGVTAE